MSMKENINDIIARNVSMIMKSDHIVFDEALDIVNAKIKNLVFYEQTKEDINIIQDKVNTLLKRI